MFKKGFIFLVGVLMCSSASFAREKFGYLNIDEILQIMPEREEAIKKIDAETAQYETILSNLRDELTKKYTAFQQEQETMSEGIKAMRLKEISDLDQRTKTFYEEASQNLQKLQAQVMQPVEEKLTKAIKTVGEENGFTSIIDVRAALYLSPTKMIDVAPLVKAKLGIK